MKLSWAKGYPLIGDEYCMNKKLHPYLIQLTQDACLKTFWRKGALRTFLKQHQISESRLATWHEDESKRLFLAKLFDDLINVKDNKGHEIILKIAISLAGMTHFPDLEKWEDSEQKIREAKESVARLRAEVNKINRNIEEEKEAERRRKEAEGKRRKIIEASLSLEKLSEEMNSLVSKQGTQEGGYEFEKWFYSLANFFEITSRPPYNAGGRQIDGSLTLEGTTFLIETKFTMEKSGSPDIDTFLRKVTSKADNTMGIFLSMPGFTSGAIDDASHERTPIILLDFSHLYSLVLNGTMSLPDVIRRVKRHASQTGEAFLAAGDF